MPRLWWLGADNESPTPQRCPSRFSEVERRVLLTYNHMGTPVAQSGAEAQFDWEPGVARIKASVEWRPASVLTTRLNATIRFAQDHADLSSDGPSPLNWTVEVANATRFDAVVATLAPSSRNQPFGSGAVEQAVTVILTQWFGPCSDAPTTSST